MELVHLTEDEFENQFQLVPNHINPEAGWSTDDGPGCLFETFGPEFEFVKQCEPDRIWTVVDGDAGTTYLLSGLHYVNRVGYLITTESVPPETSFQVFISG